jgi:SanA protein
MKLISFFRRFFLTLIFLAAAGFLTTLIINIAMIKSMEKYIYNDIDQIPSRTTVMVLGAQIRGQTLSPILKDRVDTGIEMIETGKGHKLLLTGDSGQMYYDETNAMRLYVLANAPDILHEDIFMDHAGFSTWDSMYRAREIFEVNDLLIVTQKYHISRAVCMARSLGIDAVGFAVDEEHFMGKNLQAWRTREYLARIKAVYSIVFKIKPRVLGDKIPITGDGRITWD